LLTTILGSGKSSILSAILGEIRCVYGTVSAKGRIAYVGQQPFIQNGTVRDNIIFGLPVDEMKYSQSLVDCCLEHDLNVLPSGDRTEIGERGINLSGGTQYYLRTFYTSVADELKYVTTKNIFFSVTYSRSESSCRISKSCV